MSRLEVAATLRQPRYLRLFAVMVIVALVCVAAGTWQIYRFEGKVHENDALTTNAHAAARPVAAVLPLVSGTARPTTDDVRYRPVTATGHYAPSHQAFVRMADVDGTDGYYVLTPFVTKRATLLLVRGFVAQNADGKPPTSVAAPPSGTVTVRARAQTSQSGNDLPDGIPAGQVATINATRQAQRLGTRVYDGWAQLLAGQPGGRGITAIPDPDLSNPAGGALEPQHFAYIVQWYLFALLALALPFILARAERRERDKDDEHPAPQGTVAPEPAPQPTEQQKRTAKLADRYGHTAR